VRNQPIGAVIGSTPAVMDPPSLDPPPDADYGHTTSAGTFAGTYKERRAIIFFGANDGMVHAVDARTGFEVWAFIPYNLLPKLRTLMDGQSVEQFDYFVDSSPKIAEVKLGGSWRSMLLIGQAYGGVFYTAFDVTEAGMGVAQDADGLGAVSAMLDRFDAPDESISFKWSFPNFSSFDPTINYTTTLTDGFPGGRVTLYGDLKASADAVEKRVGFTFSDPAVGTLTTNRSLTGVITGSGYFPAIESSLPNRAGIAAGRSLFMLNADTGRPVGNASGGGCAGIGCLDLGEVSNGRKNTLQADLTAAGVSGASAVTLAYAGDGDGRYWRFGLADTGTISATLLVDTGQPIYSSSALLQIGTNTRYLFFGTGSDQLSASTPGGGSNGSGTPFRLYGVKDNATSGTVTLSYVLEGVKSAGLLTNGERPTASPTVAGDIVFFTTTVDTGVTACADALTRVYAFTYLGTAAYDANGNGKLDANESPVVATSTGRGTAPFIVDQHLFFSTSSLLGAGVTMLGDPEDFNNGVGQVGVRILSWREIR
jgi:Tfp pilus tip-associated adhesin PilY1